MKIIIRYHLTPVIMAIIKAKKKKHILARLERKTTLTHCIRECKLVLPL